MHILIQLGWFGGWVLGIVGFFIARSARLELRQLRGLLTAPAISSSLPRDSETEVSGGSSRLSPQASAHNASLPEGPPPVSAVLPHEKLVSPPRDLEALLTTRWGVWLGSAALLFAGIFLIRYAVEQALLGPTARCGAAALLGLILLAAAEWLHRNEGPELAGPFRIDQAPSALAAGGTAILFGSAYGAGPLYHLLPLLAAFVSMATVSLVGLAAALRYGPLTAATGLVGAFITPALVATQTPSFPGLFAYLFIVSAASLLVVRRTAWIWLGWATTVAGAIWVCFAAIADAPGHWAAAAFVTAAATLNLFLLPPAALDHPTGRRLAWIPFAVMGAAGVVLAFLTSGLAPHLALFLLSPIAVWKAVAEPRLDRLPWVAALFGLLTLLMWQPLTAAPFADVLRSARLIEGIQRGAWRSQAILAFMATAGLYAAFSAAVGLWLERRASNSRHWSALPAAIPVLCLAITYARIELFQGDLAWAAVALVLAAALTATAAAASRDNDHQRTAIHAAGAVAALSLGCAMLLHDYWLTLAVALFLPALAWIEAQAKLPPLRKVALAVAAVVIVRLMLNWYVLDYVFGTMPLVNGLVVAFAAPGAAFALASFLFRRRADDLLVAMLEAGAVTFAALFVALEIRHGSGGGQLEYPFSFTEVAIHLLTVAVQATVYLYLAQRTKRLVLRWAWQILGGISLIDAVALLILNPLLTGASAGVASLIAAYLAPAVLAVLARQRMPDAKLRRGLGAYAAVGCFAWITLQIRQLFHPDGMALHSTPIEGAELWAWSGGWLAYGIALMIQGIRSGQRLLRLTALGVVGLVCAKVFLFDMSGLAGLWRVLSFLGLGLALIFVGAIYRRFVLPTEQSPTT